MDNNRVVITGLGIVSPSGIGKKIFEGSLKNGVSTAKKVDFFDTSKNKCKIACSVSEFTPSDYLDAKTIKRTSRFIQLAIAASTLAIADSVCGTMKEVSLALVPEEEQRREDHRDVESPGSETADRTALGLPVLSLREPFLQYPDEELFNPRSAGGHFNPRGHELTARLLQEELQKLLSEPGARLR